MKSFVKFVLIFTVLWMAGFVFFAYGQCGSPTNITYKSGDLSFYPTDGASVYELWINNDTVPGVVSTPSFVDRQGKYHYILSGRAHTYFISYSVWRYAENKSVLYAYVVRSCEIHYELRKVQMRFY